MIREWRPTDTGQCSRPHCREPAVAMLNRGMSQHHLGITVDAWWRYCPEHLADYGKYVGSNGRVCWLPGHGPVQDVDTGGRP